MKRNSRLIVFAALVIAVVLSLTLAGCAPQDAAQSPGYVSGDGTVTIFSEGDRDPMALTGPGYDGETLDIADWRGQVVVVNAWYAACPPCRAEAPDLVALDAEDNVQLLGVNSRDEAATAEAFDRTFGVEYPSIDDNDGAATAQLQGIIAMNAVPTSLVIDPEGNLYARVVGRIEPSTLRSLVHDAAASTGLELDLVATTASPEPSAEAAE